MRLTSNWHMLGWGVTPFGTCSSHAKNTRFKFQHLMSQTWNQYSVRGSRVGPSKPVTARSCLSACPVRHSSSALRVCLRIRCACISHSDSAVPSTRFGPQQKLREESASISGCSRQTAYAFPCTIDQFLGPLQVMLNGHKATFL